MQTNTQQDHEGLKPQSKQTEQIQKEAEKEQVHVEEVKVQQIVSEDQMTVQQNIEQALELKKSGNDHFSGNRYEQAIKDYRKGLQYLFTTQQEHKKIRAILFSNISISLSKIDDCSNSQQIMKYCKKALKYDPQYYKAWLNLANQQQRAQKWQEALQSYQEADKIDQKLNKTGKFVKNKIEFLQPKVNQINQKRKQQVISGLKNIGNSVLGYFGMSLDQFKLEQNQNGGYNIAFKQ